MPQKPWERYAAGGGPWEKYGADTTASATGLAPAVGTPEFNRRNALLMMQGKAAAAAPPPAPPSFEWGGLRGLGQAALDLPRSIWELGKAATAPPETPGEKTAAKVGIIAGPLGIPAAMLAQRLGSGMVESSKKSYEQAGAAAEEGFPEESALHATAATLPFLPTEEFLTEGQVDPWAALFRLAGNTLTGAALARFLPKSKVTASKRVNKLSFATGKSTEASIPKSYTRVLDEIDRTVRGGARPKTPQELGVVIDSTLTRLNNKFNTDLQPIAGQSQVPISVSDAIRDKINSAMGQTAEGKALAKTLMDRATEFEKPWTIRALNEERMRLFRLRKEGAGARAQLRTDADLIADTAAEDALRDLVYDELGSHYGRPGYYADLKSKQSALLTLKDQLRGHVISVENETANILGAPWFAKVGGSVYGQPASGRLGTSVHQLQSVIPGVRSMRSPQKLANKAMKGAFRPARPITRVLPPITASLPQPPLLNAESLKDNAAGSLPPIVRLPQKSRR